MMSFDPKDIEFGGPATYRIVVLGRLGDDWIDRLAGMGVSVSGQCPDKQRTTLVGDIRDQAELKGVLDTLYGLHLPVLQVETIDDSS